MLENYPLKLSSTTLFLQVIQFVELTSDRWQATLNASTRRVVRYSTGCCTQRAGTVQYASRRIVANFYQCTQRSDKLVGNTKYTIHVVTEIFMRSVAIEWTFIIPLARLATRTIAPSSIFLLYSRRRRPADPLLSR